MQEPWMMLDCWGNPIPATALDRQQCRAIMPDELRPLSDGSDRLAELLAKYRCGDTILGYDSSEDDWALGMGSAGYALVRGGFLVDDVVLRMN